MTETRIGESPVETYLELFCHRRDVFAQQTRSGSYFIRREPVTINLIRPHLHGQLTAGWYGPGQDGTTRWIVLDADRDDGLEQLQQAWRQLDEAGLPSYLELSRRGGHLWIFFEPSVTARAARRLVLGHASGLDGVEVYPKQDQLDQSMRYGSLIRGPLGIHRLTGRRYPFVDPVSGKPVAGDVRSTLEWLAGAERVSAAKTADVLAGLVTLPENSGAGTASEPSLVTNKRHPSRFGSSPVQRLKSTIGDPYAFISQFVELDERGRGHCPFHPPDRHPSFVVNRAGGYWVCFHEVNPRTGRYLGGDAIEFYRRLWSLSHREALAQLQQLVRETR